jgi:hypothetical protein
MVVDYAIHSATRLRDYEYLSAQSSKPMAMS